MTKFRFLLALLVAFSLGATPVAMAQSLNGYVYTNQGPSNPPAWEPPGSTQTLTGDVTSVGTVTTVAKIQGTSVSGTSGTGNVLFSTDGALSYGYISNPTIVGPAPVLAGSTLAATGYAGANTILLNTASGSVVTLPAATGTGSRFHFIVSATITSNAHKILAASASDYIIGQAWGFNGSTAKVFASPAATNSSIQMPYSGSTPSGGTIGDDYWCEDIATHLWWCTGRFQAGTTPTTPFSSSDS